MAPRGRSLVISGLVSVLISSPHCQGFVSVVRTLPMTQRGVAERWCLRGTPGDNDRIAARDRVTQESELFEWMSKNFGVEKKVSLRGERRGLFVEQDIGEGEGLYGQTEMCWEAAGDLREPVSDNDFLRGMTWDVRLAVALLEATADPQVGGQFWDLYSRLLPDPHTVSVPFCLPERLLAQLHNKGMAEGARRQKERLTRLYPALMQTLLSHRITAPYSGISTTVGASGGGQEGPGRDRGGRAEGGGVDPGIPMALTWAFAMVRSRAFGAGEERFALVPFLDMANHEFNPSANFTFEAPGVFRMRALRDISSGEEATISYGDKLDADRIMAQYGFTPPATIPNPRPLADLETRAESGTAASGHILNRCSSSKTTTTGEEEVGEECVREGARAVLKEMEAYWAEEFPTDVRQDQQLLSYCQGEGRGKVDMRLEDVVAYRAGRKGAHRLAMDMLDEFLGPETTAASKQRPP